MSIIRVVLSETNVLSVEAILENLRAGSIEVERSLVAGNVIVFPYATEEDFHKFGSETEPCLEALGLQHHPVYEHDNIPKEPDESRVISREEAIRAGFQQERWNDLILQHGDPGEVGGLGLLTVGEIRDAQKKDPDTYLEFCRLFRQ